MTHLQEGDKLPYFKATDEEGKSISSDNISGKKIILFFYPKDDTPGCTKEACSLRDGYKTLQNHGYEVLGISPDNERKHKKFKDKYEFPFSLLADPEKQMLKDFGLWGPKKFMGREYIGVHRTTFIANESGIIEKIIKKVKTKDHANQILEELSLI